MKDTNAKRRAQRVRRSRVRAYGTAEHPRLAVFRSNRHIYAQLIDDVLGKTLAAASSMELKKKTGSKSAQAAEVGKLIAEKAKKAGISEAVFDRRFYKYHGRIKEVAENARAGGLKF